MLGVPADDRVVFVWGNFPYFCLQAEVVRQNFSPKRTPQNIAQRVPAALQDESGGFWFIANNWLPAPGLGEAAKRCEAREVLSVTGGRSCCSRQVC